MRLKEQLKNQILDTERLLFLVKDHPLMAYGLEEKLRDLKEKFDDIPDDLKEAKVKLLFSGKAVVGSQGIKAKFITEAIKPFQELVKTQTALVRYGKVGKRGKSKNYKNSDLYLTALPIGSFGVELSQLSPTDFFAEEEISVAIQQVMDLVEASVKSDQVFEEYLENIPSRNLNNLKTFLKKIDEEKSILKIESGEKVLDISEESVHKAFERVNAATKEEEEIFENGILKGVFLVSAKFEFINEDGYKYTGLINPKIPEDLLASYLNESCNIHLKKSKTKFISGNEKTTYELIGITDKKEEVSQYTEL